MFVIDKLGNKVPLVDLQGKFRPEMGKYAGKYVKNEFYSKEEIPEKSIDVEIAIQLKEENKAFSVAKYEHSCIFWQFYEREENVFVVFSLKI